MTMPLTLDLYPHQLKALMKLENGNILKGGVGTGKSRVAVEYYVLNEEPKDVYVITTAKKRDSLDWNGEFARVGVGTTRDATMGGVLRVDSWNNIHNYTDVQDAFFIFDEQRLVGSGTWAKSFVKISRRNRWILLTATPGDSWLDYIPVFVANGFYKNRTEFKLEHVVYNTYARFPKVDHYVGVNKLVKHRNAITVEMPMVRHTVRRLHTVQCKYDKTLMNKAIIDRWHVYEDRPLRDVGELFLVMRKIVNSDPSRLVAIRQLLVSHPKVIIFYNFNYELDYLRTLSDVTNVAEWNGHKHEQIPVEKDKWAYLVQYTAGAEGWNCTETDSAIFASQNYSYKIFEQSQGRIDRLDTLFVELNYWVLMSDSQIDFQIWQKMAEKKDFQEINMSFGLSVGNGQFST
jgi:hypothetical protein